MKSETLFSGGCYLDKTDSTQAPVNPRAETRTSRAETRTSRAETRTSRAGISTNRAGISTNRAETRTSRAGIRTNRAGIRTSRAETRTSRAETRTSRAGIRTNRAETRTNRAETRTSRALLGPPVAQPAPHGIRLIAVKPIYRCQPGSWVLIYVVSTEMSFEMSISRPKMRTGPQRSSAWLTECGGLWAIGALGHQSFVRDGSCRRSRFIGKSV